MKWKIDRKERRATVDAEGVWTWKPPTAGELKAYEYDLERSVMVFSILDDARDSFRDGTAKYANACEETKNLIDETNKAALELVRNIGRIDQWLSESTDKPEEPRPISTVFAGSADDFVAFAREWIAAQGHDEEMVKNSSRELSEKSARALPKTAENVNDSSLAEMPHPSESDSKPKNISSPKIASGAST